MNCLVILNNQVVAELPHHPWGWSSSTALFDPFSGEVWGRLLVPEAAAYPPAWSTIYAAGPESVARSPGEIPGSLIWHYHDEAPSFFTRDLLERELFIHCNWYRRRQQQ